MSFVYFIKAMPDGPVKIGVAADPRYRLEALQTGNPAPLRIIGTLHGGQHLERELHQELSADRIRGEWFRDSPALRAAIERIGATCRPDLNDATAYKKLPGYTGPICTNCGTWLPAPPDGLCSACVEFAELRSSGIDPFADAA